MFKLKQNVCGLLVPWCFIYDGWTYMKCETKW